LNARHTLLAMLAAAGTALGTGSIEATTVPGDLITGNLTAVNGTRSLNIDGHTYLLKDGSRHFPPRRT
jgi:hypothetical protein